MYYREVGVLVQVSGGQEVEFDGWNDLVWGRGWVSGCMIWRRRQRPWSVRKTSNKGFDIWLEKETTRDLMFGWSFCGTRFCCDTMLRLLRFWRIYLEWFLLGDAWSFFSERVLLVALCRWPRGWLLRNNRPVSFSSCCIYVYQLSTYLTRLVSTSLNQLSHDMARGERSTPYL